MLDYFDCNAMLGRYCSATWGNELTPESLMQRFDALGVREGMVFHADARDLSAQTGNERLMKLVAGNPRLHPSWVLIPHHTGEMARPGDLAGMMKLNGVRVARIFCGTWQYALTIDLFMYGELFEMLDHYRIPVMLEADITESGGGGVDTFVWRDLQAVFKSFPGLCLILSLPKSSGFNRYMFPFMERYEHFAIETSGYQMFGGIETIVHRFGAHRLVFGSRAPIMDVGTGMVTLAYAELEPEDKAMIAGGNLRRLLEDVTL